MNETGKQGYIRTETVPTQAQIEVAAKAIDSFGFLAINSDEAIEAAKAALTAAAEVGGQETSIEYHQRRGAAWDIIDQAITDYDNFMLDDNYNAQDALNKIISKLKERRSYYTAAAEVSVPGQEHILQKPGQKPGLLPSGDTAAEVGPYAGMQVDKNGLVLKYTDKDLHDAETATIERCAQVAEAYDGPSGKHGIAAAIRALEG